MPVSRLPTAWHGFRECICNMFQVRDTKQVIVTCCDYEHCEILLYVTIMNTNDESGIKYDKVRSSRAVQSALLSCYAHSTFNLGLVVWIHWLSWRNV